MSKHLIAILDLATLLPGRGAVGTRGCETAARDFGCRISEPACIFELLSLAAGVEGSLSPS
jgi:hypothetical protein